MTIKNRRNFYRILFVQPDAPAAAIKASYRTLMGPLKRHPDLGGDHDTAALINEAYRVLGDPVRREAYARTYRPVWARTAEVAATVATPGWDASTWLGKRCCPFCRVKLPRSLNTHCERCACPLGQPMCQSAGGREFLGRRATPRVAKSDPAILYPDWQAHPIAIRMRDLSVSGIGFYSGIPLSVGQPVRIASAHLDGVALVLSARRREREWLVNGRLLTIDYTQTAGVFVSDVA